MSFHTIFVLIKNGQVQDVSPFLSADKSIEWWVFADKPAEVWACRVSESAAAEIKNCFAGDPIDPLANYKVTKRNTDPLKLLKMYSHSMTKVHDLV